MTLNSPDELCENETGDHSAAAAEKQLLVCLQLQEGRAPERSPTQEVTLREMSAGLICVLPLLSL